MDDKERKKISKESSFSRTLFVSNGSKALFVSNGSKNFKMVTRSALKDVISFLSNYYLLVTKPPEESVGLCLYSELMLTTEVLSEVSQDSFSITTRACFETYYSWCLNKGRPLYISGFMIQWFLIRP